MIFFFGTLIRFARFLRTFQNCPWKICIPPSDERQPQMQTKKNKHYIFIIDHLNFRVASKWNLARRILMKTLSEFYYSREGYESFV